MLRLRGATIRRLFASGLACWLIAAAPCEAGVVEVVNAQRLKKCGAFPAPRTPIRLQKTLSSAAALLPSGMRPSKAALQYGYRGGDFSVIHLQNYSTDESIAAIFAKNYCDTVNNPDFKDIGLFIKGADTWILFAAPHPLPSTAQAKQLREEVLRLVNLARAKPRRCGKEGYSGASPVQYSDVLEQAAVAHSKDMAARDVLSHEGRNGDHVDERVTQAGYHWGVVGENVAAGQNDASEVVAGWLASPGHCTNIMEPKFTHMAVAFATNNDSRYGIFWTQVFAAPSAKDKRPR